MADGLKPFRGERRRHFWQRFCEALGIRRWVWYVVRRHAIDGYYSSYLVYTGRGAPPPALRHAEDRIMAQASTWKIARDYQTDAVLMLCWSPQLGIENRG